MDDRLVWIPQPSVGLFDQLFVGYGVLNGWLDAVVWMLLFDVLINGYPVMLQRYNRVKLQELVDHQVKEAV